MDRQELLRSPEYWMAKIQSELYDQIRNYMNQEEINQTQLAERLQVSKGYVTQILNGDFDHRISKLVELSLAIGKVPKIDWKDLETVLQEDVMNAKSVTWQVMPGGYTAGQTYTPHLYPNASRFFMEGIIKSV
jgi:transcriptional regulator with XRE-family HTH domain